MKMRRLNGAIHRWEALHDSLYGRIPKNEVMSTKASERIILFISIVGGSGTSSLP